MKLQAQAQLKLRQLAETGSMPESQCGRAFLKLLAPVLDSGVVGWRRSSGGRRLEVTNVGALSDFCRQQFPDAIPPGDAGNRIAAVGRFRDTKAMANNEADIILLRVWKEDSVLKNGEPVGAAAATAAHGVFAFLMRQTCHYELRGPCALVENPAVFVTAERLKLNVDAIIYGHGRISSRVLDWLARTADSSFSLVHLPDYDPVGLVEFQRLHAQLKQRVTLHLPADLDARFARFSNAGLLTKTNSQTMLAQLRHSDLPEIRRVVELIDRHNAGLEQEALLIQT